MLKNFDLMKNIMEYQINTQLVELKNKVVEN